MSARVRVDEFEIELAKLSDDARVMLAQIQSIDARLKELAGMIAVLNKARNGYIGTMKNEIIYSRTGVDLTSLFSD